MPLQLGLKKDFELWRKLFNPVEVLLKVFSILFEIISGHFKFILGICLVFINFDLLQMNLQVKRALLQNFACSLAWCSATPLTGTSPHQPLEDGRPLHPGSTPQILLSFISSRPSSRITFQFSRILSREALKPVSLSVQTGLALKPSIALIGLWYLTNKWELGNCS